MCHFILAVLPDAKLREAVAARCDTRLFAFEPLPTGAVTPLRAGEVAFRATAGRCDCGTEVGRDPDMTSDQEARQARAALRRAEQLARRKGWSPARLSRWAAEKGEREAHRIWAAQFDSESGVSLDAWCVALRAVVEQGAAPWIGLVVHEEHGGAIESKLTRRERVRLRALSHELLRGLEGDVLYAFMR